VFSGPISLSFFPWIGLKINNITLKNPSDFPQNIPFAQIKQAELRVKTKPLLTGNIEVGKLIIDGANLNLLQAASGRTNWQNLTQPKKLNATEKNNKTTLMGPPVPVNSKGFRVNTFNISNFELKNVQVSWKNNSNLNTLFVTGVLNFKANASASLSSSAHWLKTLSGKGSLEVNQGVLYGIDLNYLINRGLSLLNQKLSISSSNNTNQTPFSKVTASFVVNNGVIRNDDFYLASTALIANGSGLIDLSQESINYKLVVNTNLSDENEKINQYKVPLSITGSLKNPSIQIDIVPAVTNILKNTLQKQVTKQLQKNIPGGEIVGQLLDQVTK